MAAQKNPLFDTATTLGKIVLLLGVSSICGVLVAGLMVPAAALTGTAASNSISFFDDLPADVKIDAPQLSTKLLANDGSLIANFYDQNRIEVGLDEMSPYIKDGIVAIEDARYYEHGGIDTTGILRALAATANGGRQGASTLTQQYVNNVIIQEHVANGEVDQIKLGGDKTVGDKVREMKLSIALEKKYSKEDILKGYLNIVLFGNATYGVEAASNLYFGVHAKDLTLPQAALLAGIVNSPEYYNPIKNPDNAKGRRNLVLGKMLETKKISQADYDAAVATPVTLNVQRSQRGCTAAVQAPYFCDYIQNQIMNDATYGATPADREKLLARGGLTIKTTLDPRLQGPAQAQVNDTQPADDPSQKGTALVTVQPGTGKILAMAQNTRYNNEDALGQTALNFNVDARDGGGAGFQPGSTVKTVTFAQWLNSGRSMGEIVNAARRDYPISFPWKASCTPGYRGFGSYSPSNGTPLLPNDGPDWYKSMSVREGIAQSINTATFATASQLDLCDITAMAAAMGLHSAADGSPLDFNTYISSLIGGGKGVSPLTMANAFATFASGGVLCTNSAIESITDNAGKEYPVRSSDCKQTIKPEVAAAVNTGLQDALGFGPGRSYGSAAGLALDPSNPAAAKTGTTDGSQDTWIVGYTPKLATASWWGYWKEGSPQYALDFTYKGKFYTQVDGANIAGPQWKAYMQQVVGFYPGGAFPTAPANLVNPPYVKPTTPVAPTVPSTPAKDNTKDATKDSGASTDDTKKP
ncbi:transglycosylase domain-containing protein [Pseudarthrobacter sp. P1]|uniref:transglycosylase domain-containing protein n=1 Tax=Pseudarthrobacter sp. P1 TaxID=3418418 RepID=UPI003CE8F82A